MVHRELIKLGTAGDNQTNLNMAVFSAKNLERHALRLPAALRAAASKGSLDEVTRNAIGDKYTILDDILNLLHGQSKKPRELPTW